MFDAQHRYDNDSSLDLAQHTYNSMVPPRRMFLHSLSQISGTGSHSLDQCSADHQNREDMQLCIDGHSGSVEGHLGSDGGHSRSSGAQNEGVKMTGSLSVHPQDECVQSTKALSSKSNRVSDELYEGHSRSNRGRLRSDGPRSEAGITSSDQNVQATTELIVECNTLSNEGYSRSSEGQSRSNEGHSRLSETWCVNCGCVKSDVSTSHFMTDTVTAEIGQTQGSAAALQSGFVGDRAELQGKVGTYQSTGGGTSGVDEQELCSSEAWCNGENVAQGNTGTGESRCGGQQWSHLFDLRSYNGVISRELCQQLVQVLSDVDTSRDLNIEVSVGRSFIHSFIRSFIHSSTHPSVHSFIHPSIHSFIHSFIYSFIHSFIHSFLRSSIHSSIYSLLWIYCVLAMNIYTVAMVYAENANFKLLLSCSHYFKHSFI